MIKFEADKIKISGPKVDGSFTISFDTGESFATITDISKLLALNGNIINVTVTGDDETQHTVYPYKRTEDDLRHVYGKDDTNIH